MDIDLLMWHTLVISRFVASIGSGNSALQPVFLFGVTMKLYFLSVGYGEAIVLRDGDQCLVIDGGPGAEDPAYQHAGTIRLADFLSQQGIRKINYMICTHLHLSLIHISEPTRPY